MRMVSGGQFGRRRLARAGAQLMVRLGRQIWLSRSMWFCAGSRASSQDCHNIDAWESEDAFNAFGNDRLGPAMAKLGIAVTPEVTFHPAHEVYTPQSVKLT